MKPSLKKRLLNTAFRPPKWRVYVPQTTRLDLCISHRPFLHEEIPPLFPLLPPTPLYNPLYPLTPYPPQTCSRLHSPACSIAGWASRVRGRREGRFRCLRWHLLVKELYFFNCFFFLFALFVVLLPPKSAKSSVLCRMDGHELSMSWIWRYLIFNIIKLLISKL